MKSIILHKTTTKDLDQVVSIEANIENSKFIIPNSKEEHLDLIANKDFEHLLIKSECDQILGFVILAGLTNNNKSIEFRRIVIKEKGQGYGRKSIQLIKQHCFEKLNCHRLWLDVLETNLRARNLYQSEGFQEEGKLRDCLIVNNSFQSLIVMSILKNEYVDSIEK